MDSKKVCKFSVCNNTDCHWLGYCRKHYSQLPNVKQRSKIMKDKWYVKNKQKILDDKKIKYYSNIQSHRKRVREYQRKLKSIIIWHYSYGSYKCECCGCQGRQFLTIDHINGDGGKHRKQENIMGSKINIWLIKNNLPNGFRVLCWNCNCSLGMFGYCHKK